MIKKKREHTLILEHNTKEGDGNKIFKHNKTSKHKIINIYHIVLLIQKIVFSAPF